MPVAIAINYPVPHRPSRHRHYASFVNTGAAPPPERQFCRRFPAKSSEPPVLESTAPSRRQSCADWRSGRRRVLRSCGLGVWSIWPLLDWIPVVGTPSSRSFLPVSSAGGQLGRTVWSPGLFGSRAATVALVRQVSAKISAIFQSRLAQDLIQALPVL